MGSIESTGKSLAYLFWGVSLVVFLPLVVVQLGPWGPSANLALGIFFLLLLVVSVVGLWRRRTDREQEHIGTYSDDVYDVAKDPLAHHPYGMAKARWERTVRRLPGGDDEDD